MSIFIDFIRNPLPRTTARPPASNATPRLTPTLPATSTRSGNGGAGRRSATWPRNGGRRRGASRERAASPRWQRTHCRQSASSCPGEASSIRYLPFKLFVFVRRVCPAQHFQPSLIFASKRYSQLLTNFCIFARVVRNFQVYFQLLKPSPLQLIVGAL